MKSPVFIRGVLWVAIAAIAWFLERTDGMDAAKLAAMTWLDWTRLMLGMGMTGCITLRTFIDQTVSRHNGLPENKTDKA